MRARRSKRRFRSIVDVRPFVRDADEDDRPAASEQAQSKLKGPALPDDVEDEVDRPWLGVRRAEAERLLGLARIEVERADLRRAGKPRALNDREPDCAAADHRDARTLPDLRRLEHRHDTGRDGAPDQARLLDRQLRAAP